jgi:predicted proteasome-type protease
MMYDEGDLSEQEAYMQDDGDAAYERWRDDWSDMLRDAVEELYKRFVKADKGYYAGSPEKFKEHIDAILEYEMK